MRNRCFSEVGDCLPKRPDVLGVIALASIHAHHLKQAAANSDAGGDCSGPVGGDLGS